MRVGRRFRPRPETLPGHAGPGFGAAKPPQAETEHDDRSDDSEAGRSEGRGAEERHRDRILDAGVPGNADIVNVKVPRPMAAGISRRGMSAARNIACAIGARTKKATKTLTPP